MQRLLPILVLALPAALVMACGTPMGMMGRRGAMSGPEMMAMMREPEFMAELVDEMVRDPRVMAQMMRRMHERMGQMADGPMPIYCPMMGFTPDNLPSPEAPYEPGTLAPERLFERKCSRCHALPDPSRHTPSEWEETVDRMADYIRAADFVSAEPGELEAILQYLQESAAGGP